MLSRHVELGSLTLTIQRRAGLREPLQVLWRGKSEDVQPSRLLTPHFRDLLEEAASRSAPLELHFEDLEYLNSSTLVALTQLIRDARSKGVDLVMFFDAERKWQKLTLDALRVFVTGDGSLVLRPVGESVR